MAAWVCHETTSPEESRTNFAGFFLPRSPSRAMGKSAGLMWGPAITDQAHWWPRHSPRVLHRNWSKKWAEWRAFSVACGPSFFFPTSDALSRERKLPFLKLLGWLSKSSTMFSSLSLWSTLSLSCLWSRYAGLSPVNYYKARLLMRLGFLSREANRKAREKISEGEINELWVAIGFPVSGYGRVN